MAAGPWIAFYGFVIMAAGVHAREAKRRRLSSIVGLKGVTSEGLSASLARVHEEPIEPVSAWSINNFLNTNFKRVRMDIKIPMGNGKEFIWSVCNVPKLVEYFAEEVPAYRLAMGRAFSTRRARPL